MLINNESTHASMVISEYIRNNKFYPERGSHGMISHIIPTYIHAHQLVRHMDEELDDKLIFAMVMFHDTGLSVDRKTHEEHSVNIWKKFNDAHPDLFTNEEKLIVTVAILEHRNSKKAERKERTGKFWSNPYSELLAAADRNPPSTDRMEIYKRAIEYQLEKNDDRTLEDMVNYTFTHVREKYSAVEDLPPVYLKVYKTQLQKMRDVILNTDIEDVWNMYYKQFQSMEVK